MGIMPHHSCKFCFWGCGEAILGALFWAGMLYWTLTAPPRIETPKTSSFSTFVAQTEDLISWAAENDRNQVSVQYRGTGPETQKSLKQYRDALKMRGFRVQEYGDTGLVIHWGEH